MSRNITQGHSFQSDTAKHSCNNLLVLLDMKYQYKLLHTKRRGSYLGDKSLIPLSLPPSFRVTCSDKMKYNYVNEHKIKKEYTFY